MSMRLSELKKMNSMTSSGLLTVLKAKGKLKRLTSSKERRKLLALDDEDKHAEASGQVLVKRDYSTEEVRRSAQKPAGSRTAQDVRVLRDVLGNVSIFRKVDRTELLILAADVRLRVLQPGEILCEQDEQGDVMWVIVQGRLEAWIGGRPVPLQLGSLFASKTDSAVNERGSRSPGSERGPRRLSRTLKRSATLSSSDMDSAVRSHDIGTMVNVVTPTEPGYAGEVALLNKTSKRTCTMRAGLPDDTSGLEEPELETVLLEITRQQFESTAQKIVQQQTKQKMNCLRKCSAFKGLTHSQLSKVFYHMTKVTIPAHNAVACKGDPVTCLFLVADGECKCIDEVSQPAQLPHSAHDAAAAGAQDSGKSSSGGTAYNRILGPRSARKGTTKSKGKSKSKGTPRGHGTTRGIEIAKLWPGQLIGDVEIALRGSGHANDNDRVWQHTYVAAGPLTCYKIEAHSFEKRMLDGFHGFSRKLAEEAAMKMSWRQQASQDLQGKHPYAMGAQKAAAKTQQNEGEKDEGTLVPTPPTEPRGSIGKTRPAQVLADRFGSLEALPSKSVSFTSAESGYNLESPSQEHRQETGGGSDTTEPLAAQQFEHIPAYPSLSYATLPSMRASGSRTSALSLGEAEMSEWSRGALREEQRASHMASQHRLGTHPNTCSGRAGGSRQGAGQPAGSVTLGLGGRATWGGSRIPRRCPMFIEPPEALQYAHRKDLEQQQHIRARLNGTSLKSSNLNTSAREGRGTGSNSCRHHESSSSVPSSFPRSYSARTARAAPAPRFPPVAPALPSLAPLRDL